MTDRNAPTPATAVTRDGTRLAYQLFRGTGTGRCALVHSLAMDGSFWSRVVERLRADCDVLVYDCRGHGRSGKPSGPYTVELFANDLADLFDAVGWRSAVVAGASMGGCVTLAFAEAYPDRVEGLGLIDTTAWYGPTAPKDWEERAQKGASVGLSSLVGFQTTRWFSDTFRAENPGLVDEAVAVFLANDPPAYAETCRMLGRCDKRAGLPRIAVPTRILVGAEDYATPVVMAEAMQAAIPGATLDVIPAVRHLTPLECPDIVAKALRGLVARKEGRR